ncbi:MAG: hypothetical protein MUD08_13775 [Cytophagales bacterium]|jgi:hypothetical protein|nr:hypothetical protein [Cytophagales bacterium]
MKNTTSFWRLLLPLCLVFSASRLFAQDGQPLPTESCLDIAPGPAQYMNGFAYTLRAKPVAGYTHYQWQFRTVNDTTAPPALQRLYYELIRYKIIKIFES